MMHNHTQPTVSQVSQISVHFTDNKNNARMRPDVTTSSVSKHRNQQITISDIVVLRNRPICVTKTKIKTKIIPFRFIKTKTKTISFQKNENEIKIKMIEQKTNKNKN